MILCSVVFKFLLRSICWRVNYILLNFSSYWIISQIWTKFDSSMEFFWISLILILNLEFYSRIIHWSIRHQASSKFSLFLIYILDDRGRGLISIENNIFSLHCWQIIKRNISEMFLNRSLIVCLISYIKLTQGRNSLFTLAIWFLLWH